MGKGTPAIRGAANNGSRDGLLTMGCLFLIAWIGISIFWYDRHGLSHLLWFCDIALLLTAIGLLFRCGLLVTAQLTAILAFHLGWNIDFWTYLCSGYLPIGATSYMFLPGLSLVEKSLSFFTHVFVIPSALYGVLVLGAPKRAWLFQWLWPT